MIKNHQRGVSLIITFFIMTILLATVLAVSTTLFREVKIISNVGSSVSSFYPAHSGIEKTLYFNRKQIPTGGTVGLCNICSTCTDCASCTLTPLDTNGCDSLSCTNCQVTYNSNFDNRTYTVDAKIIPDSQNPNNSIFSVTSKGLYRDTTRTLGFIQDIAPPPPIYGATKFMESGTDATQGFQFFTSTNGILASDTAVVKTGPRSIKFTSGFLGVGAWVQRDNVYAQAGSRTSFYLNFTNLPTANLTLFSVLTSASSVVYQLKITSGGVLKLFEATNQIGSDGSTLSTGTWYRISIAHTITSATVNEFRVFLNGAQDITVTNATLTNVAAVHVRYGWVTSVVGNLKVLNIDNIYVDDSTVLTDTDDIRVTAKLPNANNTNQFQVAIGANPANRYTNVNERPLSITNGWSNNGSLNPVDENFGIQNAATGDVNLTGATLVARTSWAWVDKGLDGTEFIWNNGTRVAFPIGTEPELMTDIVNSSTYPSNAAAVGTGGGSGGRFDFYEAGMLIAYTPAVTPFDFSLSNNGNVSVTQGNSVNNTITATLTSDTTQSVSYSISGLPAGANGSFLPTSCNPNCSTILTIGTITSTPTGNYTITVTGTGGSVIHTTSFILTVNTLPPIIRIQNKNGTAASSSNISLTWNSPTTAGNHLVVGIVASRSGGGSTAVTVTPPQGWLTAVSRRVNGSGGRNVALYIFYRENAVSQTTTGNFTISNSSNISIMGAEYSGIVISSSLDRTASNTGGSSPESTGTTVTTVQAQELWVGVVGDNVSGGTYSGPTNSFSIVQTNTANEDGAYLEKIVSSTGTANTSVNTNASLNNWVGAIATFKAQ